MQTNNTRSRAMDFKSLNVNNHEELSPDADLFLDDTKITKKLKLNDGQVINRTSDRLSRKIPNYNNLQLKLPIVIEEEPENQLKPDLFKVG